jgi:hypothetical protein
MARRLVSSRATHHGTWRSHNYRKGEYTALLIPSPHYAGAVKVTKCWMLCLCKPICYLAEASASYAKFSSLTHWTSVHVFCTADILHRVSIHLVLLWQSMRRVLRRNVRFSTKLQVKIKVLFNNTLTPITVAARSKAWYIFARSNAGMVGSNPTQGMDVCV